MVQQQSSFYMVGPTGAVQVSTPSEAVLAQFRLQAMEMRVFNVGAGEAILLRLQGNGILVDGGAKIIKRNTALGQALRSYLTNQGVRLTAIVASHPHVDHFVIVHLTQRPRYAMLSL